MIGLRVHLVRCPIRQQEFAELWDGLSPVIPANAYLRYDANWKPRTLRAKAYRLLPFFEFLNANGWSFSDESVRRGGHKMVLFRNSIIERARLPEKHTRHIKYSTARDILEEVYRLCEHWVSPGENPIAALRATDRRGALSHLSTIARQLPPAFRVTIPPEEKNAPNDVMLVEEVDAVWQHITIEAAPPLPSCLKVNRLRPRSEWTEARQAAWHHERERFAERLAWFRRHQMLWALFVGSGIRLSEAPLFMNHDVALYNGELWASLRVRDATKELGDAKTGPRLMYIGRDRRVVNAWRNWQLSRPVLVEKWMRSTGLPDHRMFLVNRDGGPLTVGGVASLFLTINKRFGCFGHEHPSDQGFALHPHAIRHTQEAIMRDEDVPLDVRQRHLGHSRGETTLAYGKTYRRRYVAVLNAVDSRNMQSDKPEL